MSWSPSCVGDAVVVYLAGELDMFTLPYFRRQLFGLVESVVAGTVVLDLSELQFIGASSVEVILSARKAADARGRVLSVAGLHGISARVFEILGLDSLVCTSSRISG